MHPTIQYVVVDLAEHHAPSPAKPSHILVYPNWSPIQQLGDLLQFLVEALPQHAADQYAEKQRNQQQEHAIMMSNNEDSLMNEQQGTAPKFHPNRFDQGWATAECGGMMEMDDL